MNKCIIRLNNKKPRLFAQNALSSYVQFFATATGPRAKGKRNIVRISASPGSPPTPPHLSLFSSRSFQTGSVPHPVSYPLGTDVKQPGRRLRISGEIPPPHMPSMRARLLRMILGVHCRVLFTYITFIAGLHKGGSVFPVEVAAEVLRQFAKIAKSVY